MFHWICPECGVELPPAKRECPNCDPSAPPPLPALEAPALEAPMVMSRDLAALAAIAGPSVKPAVLEPKAIPATQLEPVMAVVSPRTLIPTEMPVLRLPSAPVGLLVAPTPVLARNTFTQAEPIALEMPPFQPKIPSSVVEFAEPIRKETSLEPARMAGKVTIETLRTISASPWVGHPSGIQMLQLEASPVASRHAVALTVTHMPLRSPAMGLAPREDFSQLAVRRTKPRRAQERVQLLEAPATAGEVEVCLPNQFNALAAEGFAPEQLHHFLPPAKPVPAPIPGQNKLKGLFFATAVAAGLMAAFAGVAYWAVPQRTMASVKAAPTPEPAPVPVVESPAPVNTLSRQIEVTGFRFVTPAGGKPEIHYLVVNHSSVKLSNMTVWVTLRLGGAEAGTPPLSRFSFSAPDIPPYESKEMKSTIEKMTQALSLPQWQEVKAEVTVGP